LGKEGGRRGGGRGRGVGGTLWTLGERAGVRWRRGGRRRGSIRSALEKEWGKRGGVRGSEVVATLSALGRRERKEEARREEEEMEEMRRDYLDYLDSEAMVVVEEEREQEEQVVEEEEQEEEEEEADYSQDEAVLGYIREKEKHKRGASGQVWQSASIAILLRAREQARVRREEWEEWAVERHGSLQAAYSNPRVKVPKLEELLVEEWSVLRPHQAGMSAYSLHSYLRRFDTLKAELLEGQLEARRAREAQRAPPPTRYQTLPRSDIPRYDLTLLAGLAKVPRELRSLLATRQRAKLRGEAEGGREAYTEIWANLWHQETGSLTAGHLLRARLHQLLARASYRHRLQGALLPCTASSSPESSSMGWEASAPPVPARNTVYPDRRELLLSTVLRGALLPGWEGEVEVLGSSPGLGLPAILPTREITEDQGGLVLKPKARYLATSSALPPRPQPNPGRTQLACPVTHCRASFSSYTNLQFHLSLHSRVADQEPGAPTFGSTLASRRLCSSLVLECLDRLPGT